MLSKEKQKEIALRREIEDRLFSIGISQQDVARTLGIKKSSVINDYRHLGGTAKYRSPEMDLTQRHSQVYGQALKMFDSLYKMNLATEVYRELYKALDKFLEIQRLRDISKGIAGIIQKMINPKEAPEYEPYRKLLNAIFGSRENTSADAIYFSYLEYLTNSTRDLPDRNNVHEHMASWAYAEYENCLAVPLSTPIKMVMSRILETLDSRQEKIIRLRFGLDGPEQSLEEISIQLGVSRERVRQIESKGLRRIRYQARSKDLRLFVDPVSEIVQQFWEEHFPPPPLPDPPILSLPQNHGLPEDNRNCILEREVEELDTSVRTYIGLKNMNIRTIGDLVVLTEAEVLRRAKNFGRKSLNELKEILAGLGLCFNMKMGPDGNLVPPADYKPPESSEYVH